MGQWKECLFSLGAGQSPARPGPALLGSEVKLTGPQGENAPYSVYPRRRDGNGPPRPAQTVECFVSAGSHPSWAKLSLLPFLPKWPRSEGCSRASSLRGTNPAISAFFSGKMTQFYFHLPSSWIRLKSPSCLPLRGPSQGLETTAGFRSRLQEVKKAHLCHLDKWQVNSCGREGVHSTH